MKRITSRFQWNGLKIQTIDMVIWSTISRNLESIFKCFLETYFCREPIASLMQNNYFWPEPSPVRFPVPLPVVGDLPSNISISLRNFALQEMLLNSTYTPLYACSKNLSCRSAAIKDAWLGKLDTITVNRLKDKDNYTTRRRAKKTDHGQKNVQSKSGEMICIDMRRYVMIWRLLSFRFCLFDTIFVFFRLKNLLNDQSLHLLGCATNSELNCSSVNRLNPF